MARVNPKRLLILWLALLLVGCARPAATPGARQTAPAPAQAVEPGGWQTSSPEAQGMDSAGLARAFEEIRQERLALHSLLVIRHGRIVAEAYFPPYTRERPHELYSVTKSFVSTLVGIAIDQGLIKDVDQPVASFFGGRTFANDDPRKQAMTLEDLLTMTSGLDWEEGDPTYQAMYQSADWVGFVLDRPMATDPGSRFSYCSGCSHVLSAIVERASGTSTAEFARRELFEPLGLEGVRWGIDSQGIAIGGWGLQLTPRQMARLGLLYLNQGAWEGRQVVSAGWVEAATAQHVEDEPGVGYGYQWWIHPQVGGYAAQGRYGQMIYVLPRQQMVVVMTAGADDDKPLYRLVEEHIVPAARSEQPLPEDPAGQAALEAQIEGLARP